jgi:hypothetical protein
VLLGEWCRRTVRSSVEGRERVVVVNVPAVDGVVVAGSFEEGENSIVTMIINGRTIRRKFVYVGLQEVSRIASELG